MSSCVPSAITQPFFELKTPDLAWKFLRTAPYLPKTVRFSVILTGGLENFNPHLGGFSKLGIPYLIATGGM